jgi:hypothetical protein
VVGVGPVDGDGAIEERRRRVKQFDCGRVSLTANPPSDFEPGVDISVGVFEDFEPVDAGETDATEIKSEFGVE